MYRLPIEADLRLIFATLFIEKESLGPVVPGIFSVGRFTKINDPVVASVAVDVINLL